MLQLHARVVDLQRLVGCATDAQGAVIEGPLAHRDRIACAPGELSDQDVHQQLTSRGTR
jgi:hypothetical protein